MQKQIEKHKETKQNAKETQGKRQSIRQETVMSRMRYAKKCQSVMFLTE